MKKSIVDIIQKYWNQEIEKEEFITRIKTEIGYEKNKIRDFIGTIIHNKDETELEYGLVILYAFEKDNDMIDYIHELILEPWHNMHEELVHNLQRRKKPESVPFLEKAILSKFDYLESYETGTTQFINQCGHALKSIGTNEAIDVIRRLSKSDDPIVKDQMLYRLSKIEGRKDYSRKYY